jgi:hypothetical protein
MKKYAAGGKCGTMSSSSFSGGDSNDGVKEVNAKLSAALAERAKQDALFSSPASASAPAQAKQQQSEKQKQQQAIVVRPTAPITQQKYSDIDLILSGDFEED